MKYKSYDIFIITGGTGGHVFPALSFSDFLSSKGISNLIITDARGMHFIDQKKYSTKIVLSSHLNKKNLDLLKGIFKLIIGFVQFNLLLIKIRPRKLITFGGYSSFIPIICTTILKKIINTKIYFHEQNSVIGKVHKNFLFTSNNIFITFRNTIGINPKYISKVIHSGLPFKNEFQNFRKTNYENLNKIDKIKILVFGGSQGSVNMINLFTELLSKTSNETQKCIDLTIQAPIVIMDSVETTLKRIKIKYEIKTFFKDIIDRISSADLCVCRAGSSTVNELLILKTPAILVPLPFATNNHQYYNAKFLSDKNGAIIIDEKFLLSEKTINILENIIFNKRLLRKMYDNLIKIPVLNSNELIYKKIFLDN